MRTTWVSFAIAASAIACKGETAATKVDKTTPPPPTVVQNTAMPDVVRVDDDHAVAAIATLPRPEGVLWIDAKGGVEAAELDAAWPALPKGPRKRIELDLTSPSAHDDPPPPDEDDPSGGSGTAMALEEGKMGKKDSDRAEGQYKMKKEPVDPQLARQQAIEQARKAGILGGRRLVSIRFGDAAIDTVDALPVGKLEEGGGLVVAAPGAPAAALVHAIEAGGAIAVSHHDKLAVLAIGFQHDRNVNQSTAAKPWIELHIAEDGVHVVDVAKQQQTLVTWKNGGADRDALRDVYTKLRGGAKDEPEVDVLVAPGVTTAQQLVDVLVALDGIGAQPWSLGMLPMLSDARIAELKKVAAPSVAVGQPNAQGDLDKSVIRKSIRANIDAIRMCYERQLIAKPGIKGTVQAQFMIGPNGKVKTATASGVDPKVASCVADAIKKITFDKPKGGGSVMVNYPFVFRTSGLP